MKALTLHIRLLQPLLATQLGAGEENSATTLNFIPGSVLRGYLIERYLREHPGIDAAQDPISRQLFFDGDVQYLNAYPLNRLGHRMLPTPLSWRVSKDERDDPQATLYDFAVDADVRLGNPTLLTETFCWRDGDQIECHEPQRYIGVHNSSEERNVKGKGKSTVYRYEALATGQVFGAVILSENESALQMVHSFIDEREINLGGSRSAGYGLVRCENIRFEANWREYEPDEEPEEEVIILTLLSDTIVRDSNGQSTTTLDSVLGWQHLRAYWRTRVVGGFNRKWGLPLVQTPALQAGSVFVYPAAQVDLQALRRLEQQGIGERCAEGFGRIAVNWYTQAALHRRRVSKDTPLSPITLSAESRQLAQRMAERRLRAVLEQRLIATVSTLALEKPLPSNAQLSRLRLIARRAWRAGKAQVILDHLANLNKAAKEQFQRARIGGGQLLSWLTTGIEQDKIWQDCLKPAKLPAVAGEEAVPTNRIKLEYTTRLLDAVLKKATKESDEGDA